MSLFTHGHAPAVTATEALELLKGDATLVDVREQNEWDAGHAPEATHLPMSALGSSTSGLAGNAQMIVICRSGRRSDAVVGALIKAGYQALNLSGGMQAWQQAGGSVVRADGAEGVVI